LNTNILQLFIKHYKCSESFNNNIFVPYFPEFSMKIVSTHLYPMLVIKGDSNSDT